MLFFVEFGRDARTPRARVLAVDPDRNPHNHVLGPFRDVAVAAHEVGPLQRLEAKIIVLEVAVVDDRAVDLVLVRPAAVSRDGRRRGASSPGEMMNGGLFSDFGRDSRTPRDAHDDLVDVVGDERRGLLRLRVDVLVELLHHIRKDLVRGLVEVAHGDARREARKVGMLRGHVGRRLGG